MSATNAALGADTFIGRDATTNAVVRLPHVGLRAGMYVIGKQGAGKSNFLLTLFAQHANLGHGIALLDAHGDLTVDALALIPPAREGDVVLLDMHDVAHPFAFDLFAGIDPADPTALAAGEEQVVAIFKKTWGDASWGPRLEDLLATSVHTLLCNPGTTIADLPRLLTEAAFRDRLVANVPSDIVRDYWAAEYGPLKPSGQAAIFAPLMNKLRAFLRHPVLSRLVSQPGATIDFDEILARRRILLVRLNRRLPEASSLLGTAIVFRLFDAGLGRQRVPARQRPPFVLYADEFQRFATPTFGELLEEARKYNIATILAHQRRAQLSAELQAAVKGAVNLVCFQLQADDARELAHEFSRREPPSLPAGDLVLWALAHRDPVIRRAAGQLVTNLPFIAMRLGEEGADFSNLDKHRYVEERLRYAVRTGNAKIGAFAAAYQFGSLDLTRGGYGRLAEAFARLRDRLLAAAWIEPELLVALPPGQAAVKLRAHDGMRQSLVRIPLALAPDHSATVHAMLEHDADAAIGLPCAGNPAYRDAGERARRWRDRSRGRDASPSAPAPVRSSPAADAAGPSSPPFLAEVDLDDA